MVVRVVSQYMVLPMEVTLVYRALLEQKEKMELPKAKILVNLEKGAWQKVARVVRAAAEVSQFLEVPPMGATAVTAVTAVLVATAVLPTLMAVLEEMEGPVTAVTAVLAAKARLR